jgi:hypothetical protein
LWCSYAMVGVDWQLALLYTFGAIVIYTSMSRLSG